MKKENNKMSSLPDSKSLNINNCTVPTKQSKKRKRKNKNKNKNKQSAAKKKVFKYKTVSNSASKISGLMFTMSSWAEHFTFAATWQLKHQVAYWKAKAKSLEYENGILHDIIRKNQNVTSGGNSSAREVPESETDNENQEDATEFNIDVMHSPIREGKLGEWQDAGHTTSETMLVDMQSDREEEEDSSIGNQNLEVSEEFIKFLMVNAKHKEELRKEREQHKAAQEQAELEEREAQLKARRHYGLSSQDLYGGRWQTIAALEMSMQCDYMADIDKHTPAFWPVIPFNFDPHYSYSNKKI